MYVRDRRTGKIRTVLGPQACLVAVHEELWEKPLSKLTEELLASGGGKADPSIRKVAYFESSLDGPPGAKRDAKRVVTYRCPSNTAVQVRRALLIVLVHIHANACMHAHTFIHTVLSANT